MSRPFTPSQQFVLMTGILLASSLVRWQFAWGSHVCIFSLASILGPLLGLVGTFPMIVLMFIATSLCKLAGVSVSSSFVLTAFGLPTLCAAASWRLYDWQAAADNGSSFSSSYLLSSRAIRTIAGFYVKVMVPLVCMMLFIGHHTTYAPYALYWLIPIALFFIEWIWQPQHTIGRMSVIFPALSSTFIAHAVGSVIWMYVVPMTSLQWAALVPVVAVERIAFSIGMVAISSVAMYRRELARGLYSIACQVSKGTYRY